jgi:hypothetical protein
MRLRIQEGVKLIKCFEGIDVLVQNWWILLNGEFF